MERLDRLAADMERHLQEIILPFWIGRMQDGRGGFYGRITGEGALDAEAPRGAILYSRILWTFSAAYRTLKRPEYLECATRAKTWLLSHFYDEQYGGVYWEVAADGTPLDCRKQFYALGFALYGLSEYHRATGDGKALEYAVRLFETIERHAFDTMRNGYIEAASRDWNPIDDMRLSDKDDNTPKTMNTHLHILEPYANLFRVWKDTRLERQLRNLIGLFTERILNIKTGHLELFFNDDWVSKYRIVSYGHDIEASWLIHEAALVLGDKDLLEKVEPLVEYIAAAADEGLTPDGSMIYETFLDKGKTDTDRHWWVQAENVVGHANLYQHFDDEVAMQKALRCWDFIKQHLVDYKYGEWHWSVRADGTVNTDDDKAGFWKCPYHNGRMCMEIIERFS